MRYPIITPTLSRDAPKSRRTMTVLDDWSVSLGDVLLTVPAGFAFDGASIPPPLWPVIGAPFDPQFISAALAHDYAYTVKPVDRKAADVAFRNLLLRDDVGEWRAGLMYRAVRLAGAASWDDSEEDRAYLAYLKERILADGRNPALYGIA